MSGSVLDSLVDRAAAAFRSRFEHEPSAIHFAPGRVNLIGEHTDYNDGFVLPVAIHHGTAIASAPKSDMRLDIVAADFGGDNESLDLKAPILPLEGGGWRNHVRGVAACYALRIGQSVPGKLAVAGNVPQGAGLSSSASLGVGMALALSHLAQTEVQPLDLARIAQDAENRFAGCNCGIMDPLVSAVAQGGAGLLIDCDALNWEPVPVPSSLAILVAHSGVQRGLATSGYNDRREECMAAARALGLTSLRELVAAHLPDLERMAPAAIFRRARHVFTENARALTFSQLLPKADLLALGEILNASHASLRDDFEVTVPAIDRLVEAVQQVTGAEGGARMTGGGFGGCIVAVCADQAAASVMKEITSYLGMAGVSDPLVFRVFPGQGARKVR